MSDMNGSLRVRAVFDELLDRRPFGDPWLEGLWEMAARTRPGVAAKRPASLGTLRIEDAPSDPAARTGKVYERAVAPPAAFLRWLLEHPRQMTVRDPETFGAKSEEVRAWRRKLFSSSPADVAEAQTEGQRQLGSRLAQRGRNKWWLFEGFTRVDACFVTDTCVLFVEGSPRETVSPSTTWFPTRHQLWRNVEAAQEFAAGKAFGVILAVDNEADGSAALAEADASRDASFPHLGSEEKKELSRHLLGFVTWTDVVSRFDLAPG
jgi:hypothetical protein